MIKFAMVFLGVLTCASHAAFAQVSSSVDQAPAAMTLWQTLKAGGGVMVVIGLLSITALAIIIYDAMILKVDKLAPRRLFDDVMRKLESRDFSEAKAICRKENNTIIAKIVLAGLERRSPVDDSAREAMENTARVELTNLWQNISYLSDIVAVAPLLGLLGTALGLVVCFQSIQAKAQIA